jgi:hypothetical protein
MRLSRYRIVVCAFLSALVFGGAACTSATSPLLLFATAPDLSGTVSKAEFEGGNGPAGPYSQYDIWLIVPPASSANAGVVVGTSTPVFVRGNNGLVAVSAADIRVGDQIQVWRDPIFVGYGAVQGPPGAPTYQGTQIVIIR